MSELITALGASKRYLGVSTDEKPKDSTTTTIQTGSTFFEWDTRNMYVYDGDVWRIKETVGDNQDILAVLMAIHEEMQKQTSLLMNILPEGE